MNINEWIIDVQLIYIRVYLVNCFATLIKAQPMEKIFIFVRR